MTDTAAAPIIVTFTKSGRSVAWDDRAFSLLEFAEGLGLKPDFSCRSGICSTCKSVLVSGEVSYFDEPLDPPGPGELLLCCSQPVTSVEIEI